MIEAADFLREARASGFDFYAGVPCSYLTPLLDGVLSSERPYVGAASEGEAVAIAAGAWLAGRRTVVMCQNSGLGNAVNPLTSLNYPFRIPTLLVVTWRGEPGGKPDEPQHELMGRITPALLDIIGVPHRRFPADAASLPATLRDCVASMDERSLPCALILSEGTVREGKLHQKPFAASRRGRLAERPQRNERPSRAAALERLLVLVPESAGIICTTGKSGRELFTLADRPQHLYQVGSMGCAAGMALGVALNTDRRIVVIDGDGAALMKLGTLATIGAYRPKNLVHVLLDNGVHDSTGGQATVSPLVEFSAIAIACGYASATVADSLGEFDGALEEALAEDGPSFVHMRIAPGSMAKLGRPTVKPPDVARRFRDFLAS
jgi:phosphonopyruvate decarboxylase